MNVFEGFQLLFCSSLLFDLFGFFFCWYDVQCQLVVVLCIDEKYCNYGGIVYGGLFLILVDVGFGYVMVFFCELLQLMVIVGLCLDFCGVVWVGDWLEVYIWVDKFGQCMVFVLVWLYSGECLVVSVSGVFYLF